MITSIAQYYITELNDWKTAINYYFGEADELEVLLKEAQSFNTVPKLAAKTEHHLNQLLLSQQNLLLQKNKISNLEEKLIREHKPVGNEHITTLIQEDIKELRKTMHSMEKEFLDARYDCDEFIADTVTAQNRNLHS